jgi:hypothetical protein
MGPLRTCMCVLVCLAPAAAFTAVRRRAGLAPRAKTAAWSRLSAAAREMGYTTLGDSDLRVSKVWRGLRAPVA